VHLRILLKLWGVPQLAANLVENTTFDTPFNSEHDVIGGPELEMKVAQTAPAALQNPNGMLTDDSQTSDLPRKVAVVGGLGILLFVWTNDTRGVQHAFVTENILIRGEVPVSTEMPRGMTLHVSVARCPRKPRCHGLNIAVVVGHEQQTQTIPVVAVKICPRLLSRGIGERKGCTFHRPNTRPEAESAPGIAP